MWLHNDDMDFSNYKDAYMLTVCSFGVSIWFENRIELVQNKQKRQKNEWLIFIFSVIEVADNTEFNEWLLLKTNNEPKKPNMHVDFGTIHFVLGLGRSEPEVERKNGISMNKIFDTNVRCSQYSMFLQNEIRNGSPADSNKLEFAFYKCI